jgi:hypothetical protein
MNSIVLSTIIFIILYLFIKMNINKYYFKQGRCRMNDIKNYKSTKFKIANKDNHYALTKINKNKTNNVMIVAHGNAGSFLDREYLFDNLENYDGDIYVIEYPGFSGIDGKTCIKNCISEIFYWIKTLSNQYHKIDLYGESIGGGLIIETFVYYKLNNFTKNGIININNIYLQSTFTSMSDVLYSLDYKLYLLYKFLLIDDLNTLKNIKNIYECNKIFIIHSKEDQLINFNHAMINYKEFKKYNKNVKFIYATGDHQHTKFNL